MDLKPVRAATVPGAGLGHAHHKALAKTTCLAGCAVFFIDDTFPVVFAFRDGVQVVVGPPEERLKRKRNGTLL